MKDKKDLCFGHFAQRLTTYDLRYSMGNIKIQDPEAFGSAVKLAGELNIDNRIMYSVGAAAKKLNLLDSDLIIGIPLSVTGKNPYFDRPG
jgi:uncharacterized ferredoxin-like protein